MKKLLFAILFLSFVAVNIAQSNRRDRTDLPVKIGEIKFFESDGYNVTPKNERVYARSFRKDEIRYIYFELGLSPKTAGKTVTVTVGNSFQHPSGSVFCEDRMPVVVDDTVSSMYDGCTPSSRSWTVGTYTVTFTVDDRQIGKETFTIED